MLRKILIASTLLWVTNLQSQKIQTPTFPTAVDRQFNRIESDILSSAEAMPADKFDFTPEQLNIKEGNFKGVRTFAGQILHLATDNILIWSAVTGDNVRPDIEDVNGPKTIKTKTEVIKYLTDSFSLGRKAMSTLAEKNVLELIEFRGRRLTRLDLVFYALTHANEHYGQMVIYLRMNGIIPPPTINNN